MSQLLNQKLISLRGAILGAVVLLVSALPLSPVQAATPGFVVVPVNNGWAKFSWVPLVRGPLAFSVIYTTNTDPSLLTLPSRLSFSVGANVTCPAYGDAAVNVDVYDFGQLISNLTYTIKCPAPTSPYPTVKTGDDYANDVHYLHGSVPIASGGAHNIVIQTNLATTDQVFWVYVRADTAPGVPGAANSGNGAIALTVNNPPPAAWVVVQWLDPTGTQWNNVDSWAGPLVITPEGRMAHWVDPKQWGTGPYRWAVYDKDPQQGGQLWGVSDPFFFPRQAGDWVWSLVSQMPAVKAGK